MNNNFEIKGEITVIYLKIKDGTILETTISTSDLDKVKEFPNLWHAGWSKFTNSYYVIGTLPRIKGVGKNVRLHRWILDDPKGLVVDHVNHNTLDNTRKNLRLLTKSENLQNRKGAMKNNKSSGIRGVSWDKRRQKWVAYIGIKGKLKFLGYYENIQDAEKTAIEARKKYMPYSLEEAK